MAGYNFMTYDVQKYIEVDQHKIAGWLYLVSCFILPILDDAQKEQGISGDICEIGSFEGKTLALLGLMARPDEVVLGLDIEIRPNLRSNLQSLFPNANQFMLLQEDSTRLDTIQLLKQSPHNGFRFFHVDGYHSFANALNDLKLAVNTLTPGGVIFLDDFYSATLPGVTQAFHHLFEQNLNNGVFPFALGGAKVFMCHEDYVDLYRKRLFSKMPTPSHNLDSTLDTEYADFDVDYLFGKRVAIYDLWSPPTPHPSELEEESARQAKTRIKRLREQLQKKRVQLREARKELRQVRASLMELQSSKFWKLRSTWFRVKEFFRISKRSDP